MKKIILPLLLLILGTGGGIAAAMFLVPPHEEVANEDTCAPADMAEGDAHATPTEAEQSAGGDEGQPNREYARMNNQFVVPVVEGGKVAALVVLSLSIEVTVGTKEAVFAAEPKLRDVFLQVLFDHANIGGFEGTFTSSANMRTLRRALKDAAQKAIGPQITDVLIIDIVRQDV